MISWTCLFSQVGAVPCAKQKLRNVFFFNIFEQSVTSATDLIDQRSSHIFSPVMCCWCCAQLKGEKVWLVVNAVFEKITRIHLGLSSVSCTQTHILIFNKLSGYQQFNLQVLQDTWPEFLEVQLPSNPTCIQFSPGMSCSRELQLWSKTCKTIDTKIKYSEQSQKQRRK